MSSYTRVSGSDTIEAGEGEKEEKSTRHAVHRRARKISLPMLVSILLLCGLTLAAMLWQLCQPKVHQVILGPGACDVPPKRREWRTLSKSERLEYIEAVQCLRKSPSKLGLNHSLYDDFPYIHSTIGNYSHKTEDFLVWHRYFLNIYEETLKTACRYSGQLTYWDWSLDWESTTGSPIWDTMYGFGGNGNTSAAKSVGYGHCVTEGPFANLEALYYGGQENKHCLSRAFLTEEKAIKLAFSIRPDAIEDILRYPEYDVFYSELESRSHDAIPCIVRGDFYRVTAPYDPVFFLHHTQLDRLWWRWQQLDSTNRVSRLSGKEREDEKARLSRVLDFGELSSGVRVSQVLDTETDILCYAY